MKFMYMDETGKNLITQQNQNVFIFGGLVIDRSRVYDVLDAFKLIYQQYRELIRQSWREKIQDEEKSTVIHQVLDQFEFHAVDLFNPKKDKKRDQKVYKENPWKHTSDQDIFRLVNTLLKKVSPYIEKLYMFKVEKEDFLGYCEYHGLQAKDPLAVELMIRFLLDEYHSWLKQQDQKGAVIPDRLDSKIRDQFVTEIRNLGSDTFWSEPILVESYSNAFTQIIDIITYVYYTYSESREEKAFYQPICKAYKKYLKDIVEEKDLILYLVEKDRALQHA